MRRLDGKAKLWMNVLGVSIVAVALWDLYQLLSTSPNADWKLVAVVVLFLASILLALAGLVKFHRPELMFVASVSLQQTGTWFSRSASICALSPLLITLLAVLIWYQSDGAADAP